LELAPKAATGSGEEDLWNWKRFQVVTQLPEKDQRAVIRLFNSLAAVGAVR
jgi:hypothetical protein